MFLNQLKTFLLMIDFNMNLRKKSNWIQIILLSISIIFSVIFAFAKQPLQDSCSGLYLQSPVGKSQASNLIFPKKSPRIHTENLLNYLSLVYNQQQVSLEALTYMLRSLEQGQLINPVSEKEEPRSIKKIIHDGIQSSISRGDLDIERLLQGLREIVQEQTRQEERRDEAYVKTSIPVFRPTFHEIQPGKFMMIKLTFHSRFAKAEIKMPFAMMDTPVTQYMWASLKIAMGERTDLSKINPSHFITGSESVTMNIEGIDVQMKPDHPVEQVTYEEIIEFLKGLNKLSNSMEAKDQALLNKLIKGHKKGDIYDLPTAAQWEFVMCDRGNTKKKYFDRDDETELTNYAWLDRNSGDQTHAVATKLPRLIAGNRFYDLEGNVWEWTKSWRLPPPLPSLDGVGTQESKDGYSHILRGGSWRYSAEELHLGKTIDLYPNLRRKDNGFRLVKTSP